MENSIFSVSDAEKDLNNLIACMRCHADSDCVDVIRDSLKTIVEICSNCNEGKNIFREVRGLSLLYKIICETRSISILESSVWTLACVMDQNVYNQKIMSSKEVFGLIRGILNSPQTTPSLMEKTVCLASTLLFRNRDAQTLFQETNCLQDFITTYECLFPVTLLDHALSEKWDNVEMKEPSIEPWLTVNTGLCFAVNNPCNEKNQGLCSVLFPLALKFLQSSSNCKIIKAVSSFLSATIQNNVHNQNLFTEYDGIVVLKHCLIKGINSMVQDLEEYEVIIKKGCAEAVLSVVGVMDIVISDHNQNSELIGKLGCISLLLKLLDINLVSDNRKCEVVLFLGHCLDACEKNMIYFLEEERLANSLKVMMLGGDEDLLNACKYLIEVCLRNGSKFAELSPLVTPSKSSDQETAMDVDGTIDLSASASEIQDTLHGNILHSQEQCAANSVHVNNDELGARCEGIFNHTSPEESYFLTNMDNVSHCVASSACNNRTCNQGDPRICPGEDSNLPSQHIFTEEVAQACDMEDVSIPGEQNKKTLLCCDYCSCKSHVISKYSCGCSVLHGCNCTNIHCLNSRHICPHIHGLARNSSHCAQYGCEKLCGHPTLCVNPRKSHIKSPEIKRVKQCEEKYGVADHTVKSGGMGLFSNVNRSNSSTTSKSHIKVLPNIHLHEKTVNIIEHPSVQPLSTPEAPLKEKSANMVVEVKTKPFSDVFRKPQGVANLKQTKTLLQSTRPLFKTAKAVSRFQYLKSDISVKADSEASLHNYEKNGDTVNQSLVSFSPFRKVDLHESGGNHKMEDSKSVSEGPHSEIFSASDMKLVKTSRTPSGSHTHLSRHVRLANAVLPKVKSKFHQNNENLPASETVSQYFVSSKQPRKQEAFSVAVSNCTKPAISTNFKPNPHTKRFSCSFADGITAASKRNENHPAGLKIISGVEAVAEKNSSYDSDEVFCVFSSICSKHDLFGNSKTYCTTI